MVASCFKQASPKKRCRRFILKHALSPRSAALFLSATDFMPRTLRARFGHPRLLFTFLEEQVEGEDYSTNKANTSRILGMHYFMIGVILRQFSREVALLPPRPRRHARRRPGHPFTAENICHLS